MPHPKIVLLGADAPAASPRYATEIHRRSYSIPK